jgi:hypothetical protein
MKRHWMWGLWITLAILIGACSSTPQDTTLPTLAILPSATITNTPLPTDTYTPSPSPTMTFTPTPTMTFTPTPTMTLTPTATDTPLPSWTPLPTSTPTATVTPTPVSDAYVSNPAGVHVRRGPSIRFNSPLETIDQGDLLDILAISSGHDWYKVKTPSGTTGWVFAELIALNRELRPDLPEEFIPTPVATAKPIVSTSGGLTVVGSGGNVSSVAQTSGFDLGGQALSFSYPDHMRNAGMTWVKRQIRWNGSDPASAFQHVINTAKGQGFRVLLSVIGDKGQIAANPTQYYQNFANFVGSLAAGGADGIEIWNEMNIDREWPSGLISGVNYTQMLSTAYQAIKSRNSGTLVISGAPAPSGFFQGCSASGGNDDCYIREMAAAGASQFMDCVGVHYNSGITSPNATSGANVGSSGHYSWYYPSMVSLYSSVFPGKPLCFTELGYLTGEGIGALPNGFSWASGNTLANQSQWLGEAVSRARQGGIRLLIVWNVDATRFGADPQAGYAIVRPGGSCPACSSLRSAMG